MTKREMDAISDEITKQCMHRLQDGSLTVREIRALDRKLNDFALIVTSDVVEAFIDGLQEALLRDEADRDDSYAATYADTTREAAE